MHEPDFYNKTPYRADLVPLLDKNGAECRVAIVKATWQIHPDGILRLAESPRGIRHGDEPWGPPEIPDLKYPGDLCTAKPGTDALVVGHAVSPTGEPTERMDVGIRVADRTLAIRVHGPRLWESVLGMRLGPAAPVLRVPLSWGLAYGGADFSDPERPLEEPRNPIGRGVVRDPVTLAERPGPQIESPERPISAPNAGLDPVGCAPIGRHFEPRRSLAGTYDAQWLETRYPARPLDYSDEHEHCAPPPLVFQRPLAGGEPVIVTGMSAPGHLAFRLPRVAILVEAEIDGAKAQIRPHLDTLLLDTDAGLVETVWRACYKCPAKMRKRFTVVRVWHKELRQ